MKAKLFTLATILLLVGILFSAAALASPLLLDKSQIVQQTLQQSITQRQAVTQINIPINKISTPAATNIAGNMAVNIPTQNPQTTLNININSGITKIDTTRIDNPIDSGVINTINQFLIITEVSATNAVKGMPFLIKATAHDGDDYVTALTLGRAPYGASNWNMSTCPANAHDCEISWSVTENNPGTYIYQVKAKNSAGQIVGPTEIQVTVKNSAEDVKYNIKTAAIDASQFYADGTVMYLFSNITINGDQIEAKPFATETVNADSTSDITYRVFQYEAARDVWKFPKELADVSGQFWQTEKNGYKLNCGYSVLGENYNCVIESSTEKIKFTFTPSKTGNYHEIMILKPMYKPAAPYLNLPDSALVIEKGQSDNLSLNDYVSNVADKSKIVWTVSDNEYVNVAFSNGLAIFTPKDVNFTGNDVFTINAAYNGLSDSDQFTVTYKDSHNDAPVITAIPADAEVNVSKKTTQRFAVSVADDENDALTYKWYLDGALVSQQKTYYDFVADYPNNDLSHNLKIVVNDGHNADVENSWKINVINQAPVLTPIGDKNVDQRATLTFQISATDADDTALTYSASNLPAGATFDSATQTFSWTPDAEGRYPDVTFTVSDGLAQASETITITVAYVNRAPVLNAIGPQSVDETQTLSIQLSASDPDAGNTLAFSSANVPAGAVFDAATGLFTWTTTYNDAGQYTVTFAVTDNFAASASEDVVITVNNVNTVPVLDTIADVIVNENEIAVITAQATDADGDALTYSVNDSRFTGTNPFSWQTDYLSAGVYTVQVSATDGVNTVTQDVRVVVNDVNRAPALETIPDQVGFENQLLTFTIHGVDIDTDNTLTYSMTNGPAGAVLDPATGVFSWTPTYEQAGVYHVTFAVTDNWGGANSVDVTITINNVNRVPVLDSIDGSTNINETDIARFTVNAHDADGDALTYSINDSRFSSNGNMFSWRTGFQDAGVYDLDFSVSDGNGGVMHQNVILTVNNLNTVPVLAHIDDITISETEVATIAANATDADGDALTYSVNDSRFTGSNPYAWQTNYQSEGVYVVRVSATDGVHTVSQDVTVTVLDLNTAPIIQSAAITTAMDGVLYNYDVDATDLESDPLTYSLAQSPAGMTIDANSGLISWTPAISDIGDHAVSVVVSDGKLTSEQNYTLTVLSSDTEAPVISNPAVSSSINPNGTIKSVSASVDVSDNIAVTSVEFNLNGQIFNMTLVFGNAQDGSYIVELGNLAEGTYDYTIIAKDSHGNVVFVNRQFNATNIPIVDYVTPVNGSNVYNTAGNVTFTYIPHRNGINAISNCALYANFSGAMQLVETDNSILEDVQNSFAEVNLPIGNFEWNVLCTNILGASYPTPNQEFNLKTFATIPQGLDIVNFTVEGVSQMYVSNTSQYSATLHLTDNSTVDVTALSNWASSDNLVATVGANTGLVTGVATGTATINASLDVYSASQDVTVAAQLVSLNITPKDAVTNLTTGVQYVANATFSDGSTLDVTSLANWTSSNEAAATINASGFAQPHADGITTISASYKFIDVTANDSTSLTAQKTAVGLEISPANPVILVNTQMQLTASVLYDDNTTVDVTTSAVWDSSNSTVATVNASTGLVDALAVGTTVINATYSGFTAQQNVAVQTELVSLDITPKDASTTMTAAVQYVANATFSDGSTWDVTALANWTSSNHAVAAVDANGLAAPVFTGVTTIGASFTFGSNTSNDSTSLTVIRSPASLSISPLNQTRAVGENVQFDAVELFDDNTSRNVTLTAAWNSSDSLIAAVDANGLATAVAEGQANISAAIDGLTAQTAFNVLRTYGTGISTAPQTQQVVVARQIHLTASESFLNSSVQDVTSLAAWTSSNDSIATVANGIVTGVAVGQVNITAVYDGYTNYSTVTVVPVPPVELAAPAASMTVDQNHVGSFVVNITNNDVMARTFNLSATQPANSNVAVVAQITVSANSTAQFTVNASSALVGQYIINVSAVDASDASVVSNTVTLTLNVEDRSVPVVNVTSPTAKTYTANNIELNFTVSEMPASCSYTLSGAVNQTVAVQNCAQSNSLGLALGNGVYTLVVSASDGTNTGNSTPVAFTINAQGVITGVVSDGTSSIANATVTLLNGSKTIASTQTDANGRYSITANNGAYTLRVLAVGYYEYSASATVPSLHNVLLTAPHPATLSGTVSDSDNSLYGVTVQLLYEGVPFATTTTNENGTYSFAGLNYNNYSVSFIKSGYITQTVAKTVDNEVETQNIVLTASPSTGKILGTVYLSPAFTLAAGESVQVFNAGTSELVQVVKSDVNGNYKVNGLFGVYDLNSTRTTILAQTGITVGLLPVSGVDIVVQ